MGRCHSCGQEWVSEKKRPAVKETCEGCGAYLHCCLNCKFYDEHAHNKCYIPTTDWVGDRAGCNFCDEFTFADAEARAEDAGRKAQARDTFGQLLGDAGAGKPGRSEGRGAFNKLFGD